MRFVIIAILAASLLIFGCVQQPQATPTPTEFVEIPTVTAATISPTGVISATVSPSASTAVPKSQAEELRLCESLSGEQKLNCLQVVAVKHRDYDLCDEQASLQQTFLCQALVSNNTQKCDSIKNASVSAVCYHALGIVLKNEQLCGKVAPSESYYKSNCYLNVAFKKGDSSICDKYLKDADSLYACKALAEKDPDLCEKYGDFVDEDKCYYMLAIGLKDKALCDAVKVPESYLSCIMRFEQLVESG